jgi:hypothetical protein
MIELVAEDWILSLVYQIIDRSTASLLSLEIGSVIGNECDATK